MARINTSKTASVERQLDQHIEGALTDTHDLLAARGATADELEEAMRWQREQWSAWKVRVVAVATAALTDPAAGQLKH